MSANNPTALPADMPLVEAATISHQTGLRLISDGKETLLSPIPLPGYFPVITKVKPAPMGEVTDQREAA